MTPSIKNKFMSAIFILVLCLTFFLYRKKCLCSNFDLELKMDYLNGDYNFDLPSSYTSTSQSLVTDIKMQEVSGNCWAFGAVSALESSLIKQDKLKMLPDFSEMNMIYNLNQGASLNNPYEFDIPLSGNNIMTSAYLSSGRGPVLEKYDPYNASYQRRDYSATAEKPIDKYVRQIIYIPDTDKFDAVSLRNHCELVKKFIFENGSVVSNIFFDENYLDLSRKNYFYNSYSPKTNHTVAIVGWDDNYPRENFRSENMPENDGAFIIKNSWGKEKHDNGFFYMSYEDKFAGFNAYVMRDIVDTQEKYYMQNIYQHDYFGMTGTVSQESLDNKKNICAVFDLKSDLKSNKEVLSDIGIFIAGNDVTCKFFLLNVSSKNEIVGYTDYIHEENFKYPGYYVIDLPRKILLDQKKFGIGVNITVPNSRVACSKKIYDYCEKVEILPGQSFFGDKYGFKDVNQNLNQEINFCIKGFTEKNITNAEKPVFKKFLKNPEVSASEQKKQDTTFSYKPKYNKSSFGISDKFVFIAIFLPFVGLIATGILHNKFRD